MLTVPPVSQNNRSDSSTQGLNGHLKWIENEKEDSSLLKALDALANNIKDSKSNRDAKKKTQGKIIDPTSSSSPTGGKWTLDAISKTVKDVFHISPGNVAAIREMLSLPISQQLLLLKSISERLLGKHTPTNDRNNTFQSVTNILSTLGPEANDLTKLITAPLLDDFYADFQKPFANYVGHQFRSGDGSGNSLLFPDVGKSGTNYTRTVLSKSLNNKSLPTPQDVFEKLLKRPDGTFEKHKGGVNMLLLYMAIVITHDLFYTDPNDPGRNLTTGYADMSFLYGFNQENQDSVRQKKNGLLKPDQWYDKRLVIQPAGVGALLVLFSRNHNYIATKLLEENENDKFSYGPGFKLKTVEDQDEELFQTARLINNGCYANIIVHDYLRTILGSSAKSDFTLNPLEDAKPPLYGNAVSIEFNVIYRWHGAIGEKDAAWISNVMNVLMDSMKNSNITPKTDSYERTLINKGSTNPSLFDEILKVFNEKFTKASPEELEKGLPISGSHRNLETGQFPDADILRNLRTGFEQSASELGQGRTTPAGLEHVEIAGIKQARALGTCSFNDFRRNFNLVPLNTFEDFTDKKEVQEALKELYGTPDNVELYAGAMVERPNPVGLRLPYTMTRAILSDAVNLLRNDRFLVTELVPSTITNWGFEYFQGDKEDHYRVLPKMIRNLLPNADAASGAPAFTSEEFDDLFNIPSNDA